MQERFVYELLLGREVMNAVVGISQYDKPLAVQIKGLAVKSSHASFPDYRGHPTGILPVEPDLLAMIADRVRLPFDEMRRAAYTADTSTVVAKLRVHGNSESTRYLDDIASSVRLQGKKPNQVKIDTAAARLGLLGVRRSLWETNQVGTMSAPPWANPPLELRKWPS